MMDRSHSLRIVLIFSILPTQARSGEPPTLAGVFPPGASVAGETAWRLTGSHLERVESVLVSGEGVEVRNVRRLDPAHLEVMVRVAADTKPGYRDVRLDGPDGVSDAVTVAIDRLPQEVEGDPGREFAVGTAVVGRLAALDRDRYRFRGRPGAKVAVDLEVRRLGFAFAPVVTVTSADGRAIVQGREGRGGDRDCRMSFDAPADGRFVVEVRDNLYEGSDRAFYRLRVEPAPIVPPDPPDPGPIAIGSATEVARTIARAGGFDDFRLEVQAGQEVEVRAEVVPGSRLDPVITVRDAAGKVVAENDDARPPILGSATVDSRLRFVPERDQTIRIEIADRFGGGGTGFDYTFRAGPARADLAVTLGPGQPAVFNVRPGSEVRVDLIVAADQVAGLVDVSLVGMPAEVAAELITVRIPPSGQARATAWIEVEPEARPGLGWFAIEATGRTASGEAIRRRVSVAADGGRRVDRFAIRVLGP